MAEGDEGHESRWETGSYTLLSAAKGPAKWGQKFAEDIRLICLNLLHGECLEI